MLRTRAAEPCTFRGRRPHRHDVAVPLIVRCEDRVRGGANLLPGRLRRLRRNVIHKHLRCPVRHHLRLAVSLRDRRAAERRLWRERVGRGRRRRGRRRGGGAAATNARLRLRRGHDVGGGDVAEDGGGAVADKEVRAVALIALRLGDDGVVGEGDALEGGGDVAAQPDRAAEAARKVVHRRVCTRTHDRQPNELIRP